MTTALQLQSFNFYGDELLALKDNATGETHAAITHILRGIGFEDRQIEYQRKKMISDMVISKGVQKFLGVDLNLPSVDEVWCISNRKLPLALAKISITPKMKRDQPELSEKLELYQDKCADVLASVFIDKKNLSNNQNVDIAAIVTAVSTGITQAIIPMMDAMATILDNTKKPEAPFAQWSYDNRDKFNMIKNHYFPDDFGYSSTYHFLYDEFSDTYDKYYLNDIYAEVKSKYRCDPKMCKMNAISYSGEARQLMESVINNIITKINEENTEESETNDTK